MLNSVNNYPVGSMQVPNTNIQPQQSAVVPPNPASTDVPANNISNNIAAMPDKRDIVGLGKALYGQNGSSYNFIKNVSSEILIAQNETEINILKEKLNASDTTDAQKVILNDMLKHAQEQGDKLKKEQGIK